MNPILIDPREWDDAQLVDALRFIATEGSQMLASEPFTAPWPPQWSLWDMELMAAAADRIERATQKR